MAYLLTASVEVKPSKNSKRPLPITVGLAGQYDCATCKGTAQQLERGMCPLLPPAQQALAPDGCGVWLDEESAEPLRWCPRGLILRNPGLAASVQSYHTATACGGIAPYLVKNGQSLVDLPLRVTDSWRALQRAEGAFEQDVIRARREMDG